MNTDTDTDTDVVPRMPREYFLRVLTGRTRDQRLLQFGEETGRLLVVVSRYQRGHATPQEVAKEIADTELGMQCLRLLFGIPDAVVQDARNKQHAQFRQFALTFAPPKGIPLLPTPQPSSEETLEQGLDRMAQCLHTRTQEMKSEVEALQLHVDQAQNDGPLEESEWVALRDAAKSLAAAGHALAWYRWKRGK